MKSTFGSPQLTLATAGTDVQGLLSWDRSHAKSWRKRETQKYQWRIVKCCEELIIIVNNSIAKWGGKKITQGFFFFCICPQTAIKSMNWDANVLSSAFLLYPLFLPPLPLLRRTIVPIFFPAGPLSFGHPDMADMQQSRKDTFLPLCWVTDMKSPTHKINKDATRSKVRCARYLAVLACLRLPDRSCILQSSVFKLSQYECYSCHMKRTGSATEQAKCL